MIDWLINWIQLSGSCRVTIRPWEGEEDKEDKGETRIYTINKITAGSRETFREKPGTADNIKPTLIFKFLMLDCYNPNTALLIWFVKLDNFLTSTNKNKHLRKWKNKSKWRKELHKCFLKHFYNLVLNIDIFSWRNYPENTNYLMNSRSFQCSQINYLKHENVLSRNCIYNNWTSTKSILGIDQ